MPVERIDYSSDEEYGQALAREEWEEQQHDAEQQADQEAAEEQFYLEEEKKKNIDSGYNSIRKKYLDKLDKLRNKYNK